MIPYVAAGKLRTDEDAALGGGTVANEKSARAQGGLSLA